MQEHNQSFTWFLGAGCSISSGIEAAGGLVSKWLTELCALKAEASEDFASWVRKHFPSYDADNPAGHYALAFASRHPFPADRQREIEMICANGEPGYGYATLAQLLSHKDLGRFCNTILTTNFDDLIADALYLYGERHSRPLVITHEALARYVRTNSPRPIVVKLHGDAHLDPKNLQPETREINSDICEPLYPFLQNHALIFVGYGGNDESILKFMKSCPIRGIPPPIYWVSEREPPTHFSRWLIERGALRVDHTDFDQLMHLVRGALEIELLEKNRWDRIGAAYYKAFEGLKDGIKGKAADSKDVSDALSRATAVAQKTLPDDWSVYFEARQLERDDPDLAERHYQEGLARLPDSLTLNATYALFLSRIRRDYDSADRYYRRALDIDSKDANTIGSYALFLHELRREPDAAETYYKRAIAIDPKNAINLGNYALFLDNIRSDTDAAEEHYKRSIEIDPKQPHTLVNYASFLALARKDADGANNYFQRALVINPKDSNTLLNYAVFQTNIRKDNDASERYYKRAIEADPMNSGALGNYAVFLNRVREDKEAAEEYFKRALEADPKDTSALRHYASFLNHSRQDLDAADDHFRRAVDIAPKDANILSSYAVFLQSARGDTASAELYHQQAIDAEPKNIISLLSYGNFLKDIRKNFQTSEAYFKVAVEIKPDHAGALTEYAKFLKDVSNDMDGAESYHKRAIEADPNSISALNSYAVFLMEVRKNVVAAERYYKRALAIDPKNASLTGNYGQIILAQGKRERGLKLLQEAKDLSKETQTDLLVELAFYGYAHDIGHGTKSLRRLKNILSQGARSHGWSFEVNIERASKDGHPNIGLLSDLASVVRGDAELAILETHPAWRAA